MSNTNSVNIEKDPILELLKEMHRLRPSGVGGVCAKFTEGTAVGWQMARNYVLTQLYKNNNCGAEGIPPSSTDYVHAIVHYHGEPMPLFVARHVALAAHFPNFNEGNGRTQKPSNCTVISILYNRNTHPDIMDILQKEEYLCNLPKVSKCICRDGKNNKIIKVDNEYSYIDIELELVEFDDDDFDKYEADISNNRLCPIVVDNKVVKDIVCGKDIQQYSDLTNACRANMVYNVGDDFDNLPPDDANTADRYNRALLYFCYQQSHNDTMKKWDEICSKDDDENSFGYQIQLRNKLSNVFCTDCFVPRLKSLFDNKTCKNFETTLQHHEAEVLASVSRNLQKLAMCEHARWNVEKLILGFSPLTEEEHYEYAKCFGASRDSYRKKLKNKAHHIDLCSYQDLRRIDPANMKYDCFLMMAMVRILKEGICE